MGHFIMKTVFIVNPFFMKIAKLASIPEKNYKLPSILHEDCKLLSILYEDCKLLYILCEDCKLPSILYEDYKLPSIFYKDCKLPVINRVLWPCMGPPFWIDCKVTHTRQKWFCREYTLIIYVYETVLQIP